MSLILKIKQTHSYADRGDDLYQTPPEATQALLRAEKLPDHILEPACGLGAISEVLKAAGHQVISGDIVDRRGETHQQDYVADFLSLKSVPAGAEGVITESTVPAGR